jgi:branched-chain amino acid transport system ATP-binding protein
MSAVLEARGVTKRFGGLTAVKDMDLTVEQGQILGLIGPNGAGKTTFFNCLTGMETPTAGSVLFRGSPMPRRPDLITHAGVARTFQNIRLFRNMTALENVVVGRHTRTKAGVLAAVGRGPRYHREERESEAKARELLSFVGLNRSANELAKSLPYGDQRRLEIARALATEPSLLLLDEPTAGMNARETAQAVDLVKAIQALGISVVLIEHDMRFVFKLCDHVVVLVQGEKLVEGSAEQVQSDERVIAAYLGKPTDGGAKP